MESENHYECEGLDQLEKNPYCKHGKYQNSRIKVKKLFLLNNNLKMIRPNNSIQELEKKVLRVFSLSRSQAMQFLR